MLFLLLSLLTIVFVPFSLPKKKNSLNLAEYLGRLFTLFVIFLQKSTFPYKHTNQIKSLQQKCSRRSRSILINQNTG